MTPFEEAFEIAMASVRRLEAETVAMSDAYGRILAQDVVSDIDMPPFDKSAMDGYACRREDLGNELTVIEEIPAGYVPARAIGKNQCAKIMTGAMVPDGADCVIMVEYTKRLTDTTIAFTGEKTKGNIRLRASHVQKGAIVLPKGSKLMVQHIALLAMYGCTSPLVSRRPRVGVTATGNELVEPGDRPADAQIRNSNAYQVCTHVTSVGALPAYHGITRDTEESVDGIIKKMKAENDVIILSGGVSMGDYDFVPELLKKNGYRLLFEKIDIKPGMPTVFGVSEDHHGSAADARRGGDAPARSEGSAPASFCFGLPGNPVSTFLTFELLVKPFLYGMMGHAYKPVNIPIPLDRDIQRTKAKRTAYLPAAINEDGTVRPLEYHGSDHIDSLSAADGMFSIPVGVNELKKGTTVYVRSIRS